MIKGHKRINRTGIATAPMRAQVLNQLASHAAPSTAGGADLLLPTRMRAADEGGPLGSLPPPLSGRGADMIGQRGGAVLLDRLGARLMFDRAGVRLYDAIIDKHAIYGTQDRGPDRVDLEQIRAEKPGHFLLVRRILDELGADSTAVTPFAALLDTMTSGLFSVLTDPRTDLLQCLECILAVELVSQDSWESLIDLASAVGDEALLPDLKCTLDEAREHLRKVRLWCAVGLSQSATGGWAAAFEERAHRRAAAQDAAINGIEHPEQEREGEGVGRRRRRALAVGTAEAASRRRPGQPPGGPRTMRTPARKPSPARKRSPQKKNVPPAKTRKEGSRGAGRMKRARGRRGT